MPANGQQAINQNECLTINLKNFRKQGEIFVGSLPPDLTEDEIRKLFEKYGMAGGVFIHKEKGFGSICWQTGTLGEISKAELDNMPLRGKWLSVCSACHRARRMVRNLPWCVSNELLEEAFLCLVR